MANLRDIRNRITSVNNTQQITKAMKMVAAAKLRKAQTRMTDTRPYAGKIREVVSRLVSNTSVDNELLSIPEENKRLLYIVIGSDRGLCGGFNNNLFKVVESEIHGNHQSFLVNKSLDLVCIGKKSIAYFNKRGYQVVNSYPGFFDSLNYPDAVEIMEHAILQFIGGKYDEVYIAYNEFKSIIAQNRIVKQVLPINPEKLVEETNEDDSEQVIDYIYEPGRKDILDELLPLYLKIQLWSALLESNAAEQGARMAAMDNATENAKELEQELRLKYNQARQSAITTEISEIVSGAQALEDT
jgi:F-type H+-transporting ATPase subunit gamma